MSAAPPALDLSTCDREPVQHIGTIQPHGLLLVLGAPDLTVRHASANCTPLLDRDGAGLLGRPADQLLAPATVDALRIALAQPDDADPMGLPVTLADGSGWHGFVHRAGDRIFLELEPADGPAAPVSLTALREAVGRLTAAPSVEALCDQVVREVRRLTGYDRVMVYRFDPDWHGAVVAEDRRPDLEPYLGLHYPASDIPAPARALFLRTRLRAIPDAAAAPVPVGPAYDPRTGAPLDLGRCRLRGVSPVHLEYLHNMGVRASLTVSLLSGGALWGLLACHHATPKRPAPAEWEACDILGQVASAQLAVRTEAEDQAYRAGLRAALDRLTRRLTRASHFAGALLQDPGDLLALTGAGGAVLWHGGGAVRLGQAPPDAALAGLVAWLKAATDEPIYALDRLSRYYDPAAAFADVASGLLALEVSRDPDRFILWFRPEQLQEVRWAGDPAKPAEPGARLHPRRSFVLWKELVRGRSLRWRPAEVDHARKLRDALLQTASRTAARLEGLLPMCAWCKKVRDEPGYWWQVEEFLREYADVRLTHGICPDCLTKEMDRLGPAAP